MSRKNPLPKFLSALPKSLKIDGRPTPIQVSLPPPDADQDMMGYFDFKSQVILLNPRLLPTPEATLEVLMHESTHAIASYNQLYIRGDNPSQERITQTYGKGIAQTLQDNPPLVKWIAKFVN